VAISVSNSASLQRSSERVRGRGAAARVPGPGPARRGPGPQGPDVLEPAHLGRRQRLPPTDQPLPYIRRRPAGPW